MGYFKDEHWIIEAEPKTLEKLRNDILNEISKTFENEEGAFDYSEYLSPVLYGLANGYSFLFMPADGSNEGWTTSNCIDVVRENVFKKIILNNAKNPQDKIGILKVTVDEYRDTPDAEYIINRYEC